MFEDCPRCFKYMNVIRNSYYQNDKKFYHETIYQCPRCGYQKTEEEQIIDNNEWVSNK